MSSTSKGFEKNAYYNLVEFYEVSDPIRQSEPISRQKLSGYTALEEWEVGIAH